MKQYNEVQISVIKISCEDIITGSPNGGGLGGGFGGEEDDFGNNTPGVFFYKNE